MDDNRFDEFIKGKIGEYEAPDADPAALANFQQRMAGLAVSPWYVRYRTELLVTSVLILFTTFNLLIQWRVGNRNYQALTKEIAALKVDNLTIEALRKKLSVLENTPPDTVKIVEVRENPKWPFTASIDDLYSKSNQFRWTGQEKNMVRYLGADDEIPEPLLTLLSQAGFIKKDGKYNYLVVPADVFPLASKPIDMGGIMSENPVITFYDNHKNTTTEKAKANTSKKGGLSATTRRALEKHFRHGIGIQIGPVADISAGIYSAGTGNIDTGGGLLAELVLSSALSVETGIKYIHRSYQIGDNQALQSVALPAVDTTLGDLKKAEMDAGLLELPVHLKYRYPLSSKTNWIISAGYTSVMYLSQYFDYSYAYDVNSGQGDQAMLTVNSFERDNKLRFYPGNLSFYTGVSQWLKNSNTLEAGLYYQHSLGEMGIEKIQPGFLGLRGVYWFKVH